MRCLSTEFADEQIFSSHFLNVQIIIRVLNYFLKMEKHFSSVLLGVTKNITSAMLIRQTMSSAQKYCPENLQNRIDGVSSGQVLGGLT